MAGATTRSITLRQRTDEDELVFRIWGPQREGKRSQRVVRVKGRKCSVGSGPGCTLRVVAPDVEPVHWLLVLGRNGVFARCWASRGQCNGEPTSGAILRPGDRLTLGSVVLELVGFHTTPDGDGEQLPSSWAGTEAGDEPSTPPRTEQRSRPVTNPAPQPDDSSTGTRLSKAEIAAVSHLRRRLRSFGRIAARRIRQVETKLRETEAKLATQGQLAADLQLRAGSALEEIRRQLATLEGEREQLDALFGELREQFGELREQRNRFEEQKKAWEAARLRQEEELDRRTAEIERQLAELRRADRIVAAVPDTPVQQRDDQGESLPERASEDLPAQSTFEEETTVGEAGSSSGDSFEPGSPAPGDQRCATPDEVSGEPSEGLVPGAVDRSKPEDAERGCESESAPTSAEAVLRRLGIVPQFDDEPDDTPAEPQLQATTSQAAAEAASPQLTSLLGVRTEEETSESGSQTGGSTGDSDEDSVEQYMARLLERLRQESGDSGDGAGREDYQPAHRTPSHDPVVPTSREQSQPSAAGDEEQSHKQPLGKLSPRAVAPEKAVDLQAMRRLAVLSAEGALTSFARRKLNNTRRSKLLVACVAASSGGALFWINYHWPGNAAAAYGAVLAFVIAILWGIQYAVLAGKLLVGRSGRLEWAAPGRLGEMSSEEHGTDAPDHASGEESSEHDDGDADIVVFDTSDAES